VRISYLHQYFHTPAMAGGTRSYEMARRLVQDGHQVTILTSRNAPSSSGRARWEIEAIDGIDVHWLNLNYDNRMSYAKRLVVFIQFMVLASLRAIRIGTDVVFASSTPLTIAVPAVVAKWRHGVPMVFEVRDLWPEVPIALGALRPWPLRFAARRLEGFAYSNASHVIALSEGMAAGVERAGISRKQITVIPNACDNDLFAIPSLAGESFRRQRPWLGGRPLVVYSGTIGRVNGLNFLVDVAAAMRSIDSEVRFLVVGDGSERDKVVTHARSAGVLDETFFVEGRIPKDQVPALLSAATVCSSFVIPVPQLEANSANKFFDALAARRPVVINHGGWQADLIRDKRLGAVLPPTDPVGAARMLSDLLRDPSRLTTASREADELATNVFARDALAERLRLVLETSVDDQSGPAK